MKKILFSVIAILFLIAANAQKKSGRVYRHYKNLPGLMSKHKPGILMKGIDFTDAQKVQFKTEKESFLRQMKELKKNEDITVREWNNKMHKLREDHKTKIEGILTPDQKVTLEESKTEMKRKQEEMIDKRNEMTKSRLGLSSEQSIKWDKAMEELKSRKNNIMENKEPDDKQKSEQMKELMKQHKENIKSILTEEQLKQLKERKPRKRTVI